MNWRRVLSRVGGLLYFATLPSCFVYDESLLEGEGLGAGTGASGGDNGSTGGAALGGGGPATGGSTSGSGAGPGSDGGTSGSGGGTSGSGGSTPIDCDAVGTTGSFTGVGTVTLVDDFEISWRSVNGDAFNGEWFAGGDSSGSDMSPTIDAWTYEEQSCDAGNHALHVVANGYTTWGVSYDAQLWATNPPAAGVSEFTGIVFWARSDVPGAVLKVGLTDPEGEVTREVNVPPLSTNWKQYKLTLAAFTAAGAIDFSKVRIVQVVGIAAEEIDFWIDDLSFYQD